MDKRTILVVEDDAGIRQGVVDALEYGGYTPLAAKDGHQGLARAIEAECDLILLDLVLPGPDGLAILKRMRADGRSTHVLIITAKDAVSDPQARSDSLVPRIEWLAHSKAASNALL